MFASAVIEQSAKTASCALARPAASRAARSSRPTAGLELVVVASTPSTVKQGKDPGDGQKKKRGRPRFGEGRQRFQLQDLERLNAHDAPRKVQALALSEFWAAIGDAEERQLLIELPQWLRDDALDRLAPVSVDVNDQQAPDPLEFALAVLELLPERTYSAHWGSQWEDLRKHGRLREAEIQEVHEQLDAAARRLGRLIERADQGIAERAAYYAAELDWLEAPRSL